jgi:hypothetical protein
MKRLCSVYFAVVLALVLYPTDSSGSGSLVQSVAAVPEYPGGTPIPTGPQVTTNKQIRPTYKRWGNRLILSEFKRSHPGDLQTARFLRASFAFLMGTDENENAGFRAQALILDQSGIKDPAFLLMAGLVQKDPSTKELLLERAISEFPKTSYSHFLLFMAAANLGQSLDDHHRDPNKLLDADSKARDALRLGLDQESFRADEMIALRWRLCSNSTDSLFHRCGAAAAGIFKQAPNLPEWLREFAQGLAYEKAAWGARGGRWASEVTEGQWQGFRQYLAQAREHLTRAWQMNPSDPAAAAFMIPVVMGDTGDKEEMRLWFDRSVAAQMDFLPAYDAFALALWPRWSGSHEEMLQFADECAQTGRFDTCVPYQYFRIVHDVAAEEDDHNAIYKRPEIYQNLKFILESYIATPDAPLSASFAHTLAAILDYKNGDLIGARSHMAALKFQADVSQTLWDLEDVPKMMSEISRL